MGIQRGSIGIGGGLYTRLDIIENSDIAGSFPGVRIFE